MVDSITLTRQGHIRHLATLQKLLQLVGDLHGNVKRSFPEAECETDRNDKIAKAFVKLQELVWETGAVSERIHREKWRGDPAFDAHDRDPFNKQTEGMRERFHTAARKLEKLSRSLWDEDAPEEIEPAEEATYPGSIQEPDPRENPNQLSLGLKPAVARAVATAERSETAEGRAAQDKGGAVPDGRVIDFKKRAANDDTDGAGGDGDDGL